MLSPYMFAERRRMIKRRVRVNRIALRQFRAEQELAAQQDLDDAGDDEILEIDLGDAETPPSVSILPQVRKQARRRRCSKCQREGCRADRCDAAAPPEAELDESQRADESEAELVFDENA